MIDIEPAGWVPDSCTLPTAEQPFRVAEFATFFAESVQAATRTAPTRLDLALAAGADSTARDLAARESGCCSFFTFAFTEDGSETVMRIDVPTAYVEVLDAFEQLVAQANPISST
ncbi:MAG: hypothetical protein JWN03_124 [Nocardia sp.]|uniref:hypothetical protein n=1 Tax=Nocardia sp. TaxID=1821 RepID=UPI002610D936|nr:hypothetical protein [Nocardia sp.]MCU1639849.1 hypothetical protein [Nocardia sp.]